MCKYSLIKYTNDWDPLVSTSVKMIRTWKINFFSSRSFPSYLFVNLFWPHSPDRWSPFAEAKACSFIRKCHLPICLELFAKPPSDIYLQRLVLKFVKVVFLISTKAFAEQVCPLFPLSIVPKRYVLCYVGLDFHSCVWFYWTIVICLF